MKLFLGNTEVNSIMLHTDTDDATLKASDLQSGVTAYARGQKVTGSGKAFAFASYGDCSSNDAIPLPLSNVNTILVSAVGYNIKMSKAMKSLRETDFSSAQEVATITIDDANYPITIKVASNVLTIACDKTVTLQLMYGKDEYT